MIIHTAVTALRHKVLTILCIVASALPLAAAAQDMEDAFKRLAQPQGQEWRIAESDILRAWSRSGSASMDLLLQRGEAALDMGDYDAAIGHLTALTDHAPDFAAGFYARSVAYAGMGLYGPAIDDLRRTLIIEPRHFTALTQLGVMLEEMGDDGRALAAYSASLTIHPNQQEAIDGAARIQRKRTGIDI